MSNFLFADRFIRRMPSSTSSATLAGTSGAKMQTVLATMTARSSPSFFRAAMALFMSVLLIVEVMSWFPIEFIIGTSGEAPGTHFGSDRQDR
ncbi:hypothetical protein D3C76_1269600 [compost metagenome]